MSDKRGQSFADLYTEARRENDRLRAQVEGASIRWARDGSRIEELEDALREILKGEGAFSTSPLTHASNCIDSMKEIARVALGPSPAAPVCSVCRTQAAGLPTPGYIHDEGCQAPAAPPLDDEGRFDPPPDDWRTRCSCHSGAVCTAPCLGGKHHGGCPFDHPAASGKP